MENKKEKFWLTNCCCIVILSIFCIFTLLCILGLLLLVFLGYLPELSHFKSDVCKVNSCNTSAWLCGSKCNNYNDHHCLICIYAIVEFQLNISNVTIVRGRDPSYNAKSDDARQYINNTITCASIIPGYVNDTVPCYYDDRNIFETLDLKGAQLIGSSYMWGIVMGFGACGVLSLFVVLTLWGNDTCQRDSATYKYCPGFMQKAFYVKQHQNIYISEEVA